MPRAAAYALMGGSLTDLQSPRGLLTLGLLTAMTVGTPLAAFDG